MASNTSTTVSKGDRILLEVFGPPLPGFGEGTLPVERDIMALYLWFTNVDQRNSPGEKVMKMEKHAVYWKITDLLMVHWRCLNPNGVLKPRKYVIKQLSDFINDRALPVKKHTRLLTDDVEGKKSVEKIAEERQKFGAIFNIESKQRTPTVPVEVSQPLSWSP